MSSQVERTGGEWIVDVDHDGLPDLVTTGWIANGVWWYRNPGTQATTSGTMWKAEKITDSYDTEGGAFFDINGDGNFTNADLQALLDYLQDGGGSISTSDQYQCCIVEVRSPDQ